jgi:UDP-N-acetylmuramoyl-tripeptide--D-alanyl-D-alanine ligase
MRIDTLMTTKMVKGFWDQSSVARLTAGRWLIAPGDDAASPTGVSIDTRTLAPDQIYVAIPGENFDGHAFLPQAEARHAALAIVSDEPMAHSHRASTRHIPLLLVDDTVAALHALARAYRTHLREGGCKVIAITGSNGKTTTRHLIHSLLQTTLRGSQSPKSFNNHLGVPLTLLAAAPHDDFVVAEVGSNHLGEIAQLAALLQPDAAVITSIGTAHIGHFGSREAIAQEKASLLHFVQPGGLVAVPHGQALLEPYIQPLRDNHQVIEFADELDEPAFRNVNFPLPGAHNRRNAAAAVAIARWMGISDTDIARALCTVGGVDGRLQRLRFGQGVTVIHDAYNANPDSMRAAIDVLFAEPATRRVAILGDMFELAEQGPTEHRAIGHDLATAPAHENDLAIFIGELATLAGESLAHHWPAERIQTFAKCDDALPQAVATLLAPGDTILLKASRGMRLERLLPAIEARFGVA